MKKILSTFVGVVSLASANTSFANDVTVQNVDVTKDIAQAETQPTSPFTPEVPSEKKSVKAESESKVELKEDSNTKPKFEDFTRTSPSEHEESRVRYLKETKTAQKDDRSKKSTRYGSTMSNAEFDSDLILNRYQNKQFIKDKIDEAAKAVVKKEIEARKSIAEQMGAIGSKKISVSIDETVSMKDAIMEVSNLAGVDIEIDPTVEGSIILSVKNTKVADVLERMADLAQLNISVKDNVVRFAANKPFTKNYTVSFLDSAGSNNSMPVSASIGSTSGMNINPYNNQTINGGGASAYNPYNNQNNNGNNGGITTNGAGGGQGLNSSSSLNSGGSFQANNSMWDQFENGLKYIVSQKKEVSYSINKQAGVVTLRAPLVIQREVEEYIERVKKVATTQILVEVRLVEVSLNDEYSSGINFSGDVGNSKLQGSAPFSATSTVNAISSSPFALKYVAGGLSAAVQFLQSFGTTKAISSPRLNVMNNQKSRLSFAKDQVYFSIQPQLQNQYINMTGTSSGATNPIIVQSTMHTIPIGIILDLQATADIDRDEITMNIHPVLSSIVSYASDPAATFLGTYSASGPVASTLSNKIPIIEKKELNSTLRIKSGDIMVIGGFNEEKTLINRAGIPYLKDIPYLRVLFGFNTKSVHNIETVIFIKATIMTPEKTIDDQDVKYYNDFA